MRSYQTAWLQRRRAAAIVRLGGCCCWCGSVDRLELDHRDPSQKLNHRVWSWSPERRNAELDKCQLLCHACHMSKTTAQRWSPIKHGTSNGYRRGCRCDECRANQRARGLARRFGGRAS